MNKSLYIGGVFLSFALLLIVSYFSAVIGEAQSDYYFEVSRSSDQSANFVDSSTDKINMLSVTAGIVILFFIFYFIFADIIGLRQIKTSTIKTVSILGLFFSGVFLFWDLMMIASPGAISFDEVGIAFFLYGLIMMAFMIVGWVQTTRFYRKTLIENTESNSTDLLDD